jgi:hypothetical protein
MTQIGLVGKYRRNEMGGPDALLSRHVLNEDLMQEMEENSKLPTEEVLTVLYEGRLLSGGSYIYKLLSEN